LPGLVVTLPVVENATILGESTAVAAAVTLILLTNAKSRYTSRGWHRGGFTVKRM
jgi:hypothetical protein